MVHEDAPEIKSFLMFVRMHLRDTQPLLKYYDFSEACSMVKCRDRAGMPSLGTAIHMYRQVLWRAKEDFCRWAP